MFPVSYQVPAVLPGSGGILYLLPEELSRLTSVFQEFYDKSRGEKEAARRARHWAVYLLLRFTGARVSEVLSVDDTRDMDWRESEVRILNLKRHNPGKRNQYRQVPIPASVCAELSRLLVVHPELKGKLFRMDRTTFFRMFRKLSEKAGLPPEKRHPHVLRHSRAVELLRAGVPVTAVQQLLGHAALTTTAVYLRLSGQEVKQVLKDRGVL